MSSSEPSSPSSVLEATTPVQEKSNSNESRSDSNVVDKSDPWAFLEKELEEFQRIVAELEQIKIQKCKSDFEPSCSSNFIHNQKASFTESCATITNSIKENNEQTTTKKGDNCDASREIPILRLNNVNEGSNEEPGRNSPGAIDDTYSMKQKGESCKESPDENQPPNENEINDSIKERLRINVNLPDTPEPGPIVTQDNAVIIQKKPKPPPPPKPNLKPKPKSSMNNPSTSRMESEMLGKNRAITETDEIPSMTESVRNSPGYKSSISYTTV